MSDKEPEKFFLDTSVVRPLFSGTSAYKQYFRNHFNIDQCYVSNYVQMEFRRSYLNNLISFYNILDLPTIPTLDDAITFWSNKFKKSELKAIIQLVSQLIAEQKLNFKLAKDKPKALQVIGMYIKRLDIKLRRQFKNIGKDSTRCARAIVPLHVSLDSLTADFKRFVDAFNDKKNCRNNCGIDRFVLNRYRSQVEDYINLSSQIPKNNDNKGFIDITENLKAILTDGVRICSCDHCEHIGDAIIALDALCNIRLEHTDRSFDHLCDSIGQPHYRHPSETEIIKLNITNK